MEKSSTAVVILVALVVVVGSIWYSSARVVLLNDQLKADESQLRRYRVVLGIDPATKAVVKELNNQELTMKAEALIPPLDEMCKSGTKDLAEIDRLVSVEMIDQGLKEQRTQVVRRQLSERFRSTMADETFVIDNELRRRMDPQVLKSMPVISSSVLADDGTNVDMLSQIPASEYFDIGMSCKLSDTLDRLSRALMAQH